MPAMRSTRQPTPRHVLRRAFSKPPSPIAAQSAANAKARTKPTATRTTSRASSRAAHTAAGVLDRGEPDDGHGVRAADVPVVELAQEVRHLLGPADRRVVVLDLPWRQILESLDLDLVDDCVEDLLA